VPVKAVVPECEPAVAKAATMENMTAAKPAAMEHCAATSEAAAMKRRAASAETSAVKGRTATAEAAAMEASAAAEAATPAAVEGASTATMAATAMPATDFGRQPVGSVFRRGHSARVDQRQRLRALAGCGRQRQHRGSRKAQATDEAAPGIWNLHHV
jgi:hypothetical protein